MTRRHLARATLSALAGLALAACGGGGNGGLSSNQMRAAAARTCASATAGAARILTPSTPAGGTTFLRRGIKVFAPELAQLRRLRAPGAVATTYATALDAFSQKLNLIKSALRRLDRGADPVQTIQTLQHRLSPVESREDAAWHALDVTACLNR